MKCTIVKFLDKDNYGKKVICNNKQELIDLLTHLDEDNFRLKEIEVIDDLATNIKEFCKIEPKLEIGKENNND